MIKLGIIGCADIAQRMMIPNFLDSDKFEVKAIASRNYKKAKQFASNFNGTAIEGYQKLIDMTDIDAVYIPLPTGLHFEWIKKALLNNKHVISEKSISTSFAETNEIIRIAKSKKLCVFENFMFPFHSQYNFVKDLLDKDRIGNIRLLRSSFGFPKFKELSNIRYIKELGGGALYDAGAYTLMAAQFILGKNQDVLCCNLKNDAHEVDFFGEIMLKNSDAIVSQLAFGFDNFYQNNIEIWGSKGKITIERAFTAGPGFSPKIIVESQNLKKEYLLPPDNHFIKIINCFGECIESGKFDYQYEQILNQSLLIDKSQQLANN